MQGADRDGAGDNDRAAQIIEATLRLLSREGISGVTMRAVAREAGVSLGLASYYFDDRHSLIKATLRQLEYEDLEIVALDPDLDPQERLLIALRSVAEPRYLTTDYLSLRLQLWALAQADAEYADINAKAQRRYRTALARLIHAAVPELTREEAGRRAADIDIIQNGIWLTALLRVDRKAVRRSVERCEEIAFAPPPKD